MVNNNSDDKKMYRAIIDALNEQPRDVRQMIYSMSMKINELYGRIERLRDENRVLKEYRNTVMTIDALHTSQKVKLLELLRESKLLTLRQLASEIGWSETTQRKYLNKYKNEGLIIYNPSAFPVLTELGEKFVDLVRTIKRMINNFFEENNVVS